MQNNPLADPTPESNALEQRTLTRQDSRERAIFVIARNAIPVIGVLFLGWSAVNLVLLYFVDTLGGMWALIAALFTQYFGGWTTLPWHTRLGNLLWVIGLSLFLIAFMAIPLGMPVIFVLVTQDWELQDALADQGFIFGLVSIAVLALVSMFRYALRMQREGIENNWPRDAFGLLFVRWFVMIVLIFIVVSLLIPFAPILLVTAYAGLMVISELYPDRFLKFFDKSSATTPVTYDAPPKTKRKRRRN